MVSLALRFQLSLNCPALMPAISANAFTESLPDATAASIVATVCEKAVPPASASTPSDDIAADHPSISACDMPTCVLAAATLMDIDEIELSVVAMWFPRLTMAEP